MLIPNQTVSVKMGGKNLNHYIALGYDVHFGDVIDVPIEELTSGSHVNVKIQCDICKKEYTRPYKSYLRYHTYDIDTCNKCKSIKTKTTCVDRYGVKNVFQVDKFKEKYKRTCLDRYNCEYNSQADGWSEKYKKTMTERYGEDNPMKVQNFKEKQQDSLYQNYGVYNPLQNKDIVNKVALTNLERYGYRSPLQNQIIKQKQIETFYKNGTMPTSSQQLQMYNIIKQRYKNAELNYPFSNCSLDVFVCINNINIDIEYDGKYWHQDQQADLRRDKYLQSQGFKVLRIRSARKIPTEEQLFSAIDELIRTNRIFKEIILPDWDKQHKINEEQEVSA